MTAFETSLNVIGTSLAVPTEEAIAAGDAPPALEVELLVGQQLPFATQPGAPPMMVPFGKVRYTLNRDSALEFFKTGLEAAEKLPEERKSNIEIATSLDGVDKVAGQIQGLKGG